MPAVADQIRCTFQPIEPTLALAASDQQSTAWVCVGKAGTFWHPRYNKFALTVDDFKSMVENFKSGAYPEPPTELPCDYDHRSLKAQSPEDGKAAGWVKDLETRDDGQSLWARVEFTPPALTALRNREFKFLSGVFAPKWRNFRGRELAATFLGLAVTNAPTLHHLDPISLSYGAAVQMDATESFPNTMIPADDLGFTDTRQKEPRMAAQKTDDKTVTVKDASGQDVTIALASLADIDAILALGRAQGPDPKTVVARTDFDALQANVVTLSTELADERTKRLAAEERDRKRTVSEWIRTGQIFPKEEVLALANYDLFAGLVADRGTVVVLNREQGSGSRAKEDAPGYAGASDAIRTAAEKYAADHKVPFAEAVIAVSASTAAEAVNDRAMALRREHSL